MGVDNLIVLRSVNSSTMKFIQEDNMTEQNL